MSGREEALEAGYITTDLLLGADRLTPEFRRRYQAFFLEVVRQRGFPLHTASLWNALYFGWSLKLEGYLGRGLRVAMTDGEQPIPVGAFVEVPVGRDTVLWAELVYKEGRDDRIDALGIVGPAASGARLGLARAREAATVREGLVLDFEAFGDGLNDANDVTFARAERRKKLTADRHKEVLVHYPAADAGVDDLTLFARHVFAQHGAALFDDLLRDGGAGVDPDQRWELLLRSLQAVDELAQETAGLRTFGLYHLDEATYQHDLGDTSDARFGADALNELADAAMETAPTRARGRFGWRGPTATASYRSVGSLVREHLGRYGLDDEERALLAGPGYARLVLEVNLAIADRIGGKGIQTERGCHVRLDDDWQGGGVWRTVCFEGDPPAESRFGPLVPLGLGYAQSAGLTAPPAPQPEPETPERTQRGWRIALRAVDLDYRDLPICPEALAMLPADTTEVLVELSDGTSEPIRRRRPLDRDRRFVKQMLYPGTFVPGTYVSYVVGLDGRLLTVRATPLPVPVALEGRRIQYEFDERVFRRDVGLAPLDPAVFRGTRSLTEQISEVFRRRGRPTADGGRALRSDEIISALLGPSFDGAAAMPILLRLQTGDFAFRDGEYIWHPRLSRRTSPRERTRLLAAREQTEAALRRILAPRMVPMRLRHLIVYTPTLRKVASYAAARRRYHMEAKLPEQLLPGHTWVEPYLLD